MTPENLQTLLNYLDKVAAKLGTTAEHIWPLLIRQQYVDAYMALFYVVLFGVLFGVLFFISLKIYNADFEDENPKVIASFTCGILFGAALLFSAANFIAEFGDIFNPEYWALKDLMEMIKP